MLPQAPSRDTRMTRDPASPRLVSADADADSRAPRGGTWRQPAVFDTQAAAGEVELVLTQGDAESARQVARPSAERVVGHHTPLATSFATTPATHRMHAIEGLERTDEHG